MFSRGNAAAPLATAMRGRRRARRRLHGGKVIPQAFEHSLAQKTVIGDAAVFDLGLDDRLNPGRLGLLDWHRER
jgi:hypothetical protein